MAEQEYISFTCKNPECGKKLKLKRPAKGGTFSIHCPACNKKLKFTLPEPEQTPAQASQHEDLAAAKDSSQEKPMPSAPTSPNPNLKHDADSKIEECDAMLKKWRDYANELQSEINKRLKECHEKIAYWEEQKAVALDLKAKASEVSAPPVSPTPPTPKGPVDNSLAGIKIMPEKFEVSRTYTPACPHCGQKFKIVPTKAGTVTVQCPKCKGQLRMEWVEPEPLKGLYEVNKTHSITCPVCSKEFEYKPKKAGIAYVNCDSCQARVGLNVHQPTIMSVEGLPMIGRLTRAGSFFQKTTHLLREGNNVIGRFDRDCPSDIMVSGDSKMSRRSVQISIVRLDTGFFVSLTVLNATNPVIVNKKPCFKGDSVYLKYGDEIIMGNTHFRYEK